VVGIRHPLQHLHGNAIRSLRGQGLQVDVVGEDLKSKIMEVRFLFVCKQPFYSPRH
jgi:diaminohydroxyphosphoribosylaminopyrimidine deaminase/5-amino-6-(5-phosphoribosylamino)uracil reductase